MRCATAASCVICCTEEDGEGRMRESEKLGRPTVTMITIKYTEKYGWHKMRQSCLDNELSQFVKSKRDVMSWMYISLIFNDQVFFPACKLVLLLQLWRKTITETHLRLLSDNLMQQAGFPHMVFPCIVLSLVLRFNWTVDKRGIGMEGVNNNNKYFINSHK